MDTSDLAKRMKGYENCYRIYLPRRSAVIVRIDGRAFHSFTKGFARPYDEIFMSAMQSTMKDLCENISGCKFGYHQSDEISLVLTDYETINTEPWFNNNLQKIVSISAAMATFYFGNHFRKLLSEVYHDKNVSSEQLRVYQKAYSTKLCVLDSRAFIVPREEVVNVFYWRQLDCIRNSIQMAGQANFSHRELQNKNCNDIQEMLFSQKGINWAKDYPPEFRNGSACYKKLTDVITPDGITVQRNKWFIDKNIPKFSAEPEFINKHIIFNEK